MDKEKINLIRSDIFRCMKVYGIEGFEDKINDIYSKMPEMKEMFLFEYKKIINNYRNR